MMITIAMCFGGLIGLTVGGEWLVRGAVGLAQRLGLSSMFTGLVIMGSATSMPEMVTSIEAALAGSPGIAWGNIAGSNLANSLLILGAAALVAPIVLTGTGRRDAAVALAASLLVLAIALAGLASVWLGVLLLVLTVVYVVWRYRYPRAGEGDDDEQTGPLLPLWHSVGFFAIGLAALVVGGQMLVASAVELARYAGVSETVIGLTVVAVGTSLPELAASVAAAWRGNSALAVGNVVGSNIYNLLLIGGVTMAIAPVAIPAEIADMEIWLMAASAALILLLCWYARRIGRLLGAVLVAAFAVNTVMLFT